MADEPFIPYRVTSQTQTQELTPDGRFVDVMEVRFETPSGTSGLVRIPLASYAASIVDRVIQARIAEIEAVHRLGGEPAPGA